MAMVMLMRRAAAYALAVVLLAGCAQLERRSAEKAEFDLAGRLAARYGEESFTGNIAWRHAKDFDEMLITTPLGQGVARIVREGDQVTLTTAEPREYHAADAESLTERVLGFRLPLGGLADWVRGRPGAEVAARVEPSAAGRPSSLEQRGWKVEYQEYAGELPSRLRLLYPGIELRLIISQWK
jgi:outer membrane lipoprotein LolB